VGWAGRDRNVGIESILPKTLFEIGGIPIKDTVVHAWLVTAVLLGLAAWVRNKFRAWEPEKWQLALETVVAYVEKLIIGAGGRPLPQVVSYLTTMISFIAIANLLGLFPGLKTPTRDLNATAALALVSLGSWQFFSIGKRGFKGYLRSFIEPNAIMLPFILLGQFTRTLAMALRLFGNVMAGEMIGGIVFMLLPVLAPLPFYLISSLMGVLQALVFTALTIAFIIDATGSEEETTPAAQE